MLLGKTYSIPVVVFVVLRKNILFKTALHRKAEIFLQYKKKDHGKAGACRGLLT